MTDIDQLLAGPELDALVAVEVMEWLRIKGINVWWKNSEHVASTTWSPSTNWSAAGEVLEEMKRRGVYLGVWPTPDGWDVERYESGEDWVEDVAAGPLAICRAALAAVREKKSG